MYLLAALAALILIFSVLWDAFETIILPRRVIRRIRLTRVIYGLTWVPTAFVARRLRQSRRRESILSPYGPLSLIGLLMAWAGLLIIGFALLQWSAGSHIQNTTGKTTFGTELYLSSTTFFTLGLGDVTPISPMARIITAIEGGTGFGLFALVIGYLPVLYQAFSRREVNISLLDARAGSPPSAVELLRRHCLDDREGLAQFLRDWEHWSAELLESHLSYPTLAYFRSQHDNQSWIAALTMVMDACALIMVGLENISTQPARLTFAIARHASVDLSQAFNAKPVMQSDRLSHADFVQLCELLRAAGVRFIDEATAEVRLAELRGTYEPYVLSIGERLINDLPRWLPDQDAHDDWETSVWEGNVQSEIVVR